MTTKARPVTLLITSLMLFSMFFGAGNLIFPPMLGVNAGDNFWPAILGFLGAGVLLPVLAVIAITLSGDSVRDLANRSDKVFGLIFPILAYLSIGTFYALPRTGAVSFETAISPLTGWDGTVAAGIFSVIFFGIALALSWKPNTVSSTVGRFLTPILVALIALLIIIALTRWDATSSAPTEQFSSNPAAAGLLEGYLTMDAIAALAFSIVVISTLRHQGIPEGRTLVSSTILTALGAGILLALIYVGLGMVGRVLPDGSSFDNGANLLASASFQTMGQTGQIIFAAIVLLACLTTAVGLITSTSEFFHTLTPGIPYRAWAIIFAVASASMATAGLDAVLSIAAPVIGFIYPPAIVLILLALIEPALRRHRYLVWSFRLPIWTAIVWSALTTFIDLSWGAEAITPLLAWAPGQSASLGWALPALIAFIIGLIIDFVRPTTPPAEFVERTQKLQSA